MRKIYYILLALIMIAALGSCGKAQTTSAQNTNNAGTSAGVSNTASMPGDDTGGAATSGTAANVSSAGNETADDASGADGSGEQEELLQSASVDLDSDGANEQVEALQKVVKSQNAGEADEIEGILRITGSHGTRDITFVKKPSGLTGVMNSFDFKDLDGDGSKDVFIVIPDTGASFSLNYFYIYNYKSGRSYSFDTDSRLTDFAGGFSFKYKGGGKLQIKHEKPAFTAVFNISDGSSAPLPEDESNASYENSWVDPTPVEININSINSGIELVNNGGGYEIKVPLPVFGQAASDMIGEVDLYYSVGSNFEPVMKRFVVQDFKDSEVIKIGEAKIN